VTTSPTTARRDRGSLLTLDWYRTLAADKQSRSAFWASSLGWAMDAFDYQALPLALAAITATFALTKGQAGLIATVVLVVSAIGGALAGWLADRIGRVRTLMLTIAMYSLFTLLSGFAPTYGWLLVLRALQGLGFGGEWAAGAILVAEVSSPEQRGRVLGWIQSFWAVGWALAAIAYTVVFSLVKDQQLAWRVLFWLGVLPGLLILYIRRNVADPEVYRETRRAEKAETSEAVERGAVGSRVPQIFQRDLLGRTAACCLLSLGAQGGYYALFTWLPTFLKEERGLKVLGVGSFLFVVILGAFLGYLAGGYVNDWLGRRPAFALFALLSAVTVVAYTQATKGGNKSLLLVLGFPLGFFPSGVFSGFGSYLAELFPTRARGGGQGFTYNFGRGVGAAFPAAIGFLSASIGLTAAIAFGASAYALVLVALLFLPETRGKQFVAID
jgi:MFS family permease